MTKKEKVNKPEGETKMIITINCYENGYQYSVSANNKIPSEYEDVIKYLELVKMEHFQKILVNRTKIATPKKKKP